jgi:hypothetical protein
MSQLTVLSPFNFLSAIEYCCPACFLLLAPHSLRHIVYVQQNLEDIGRIARKLASARTQVSGPWEIPFERCAMNLTQNTTQMHGGRGGREESWLMKREKWCVIKKLKTRMTSRYCIHVGTSLSFIFLRCEDRIWTGELLSTQLVCSPYNKWDYS